MVKGSRTLDMKSRGPGSNPPAAATWISSREPRVQLLRPRCVKSQLVSVPVEILNSLCSLLNVCLCFIYSVLN